MKKTSLYIALVILVTVSLGACTRNHGDIGIWFGTWHVERITIGGAPENVKGDYFFQFQSGVFRVSQVYGHEQLVESFGTWEESEDGAKLTVNFPDAGMFYIQMPGLEAYNSFTVDNVSHGQIVLTKTLPDGTSCSYFLKRQP